MSVRLIISFWFPFLFWAENRKINTSFQCLVPAEKQPTGGFLSPNLTQPGTPTWIVCRPIPCLHGPRPRVRSGLSLHLYSTCNRTKVNSIASKSLYYPNVTTCLPVVHFPCQSACISGCSSPCQLLLSSPSTCRSVAITEDVQATAAPPANMSVILHISPHPISFSLRLTPWN